MTTNETHLTNHPRYGAAVAAACVFARDNGSHRVGDFLGAAGDGSGETYFYWASTDGYSAFIAVFETPLSETPDRVDINDLDDARAELDAARADTYAHLIPALRILRDLAANARRDYDAAYPATTLPQSVRLGRLRERRDALDAACAAFATVGDLAGLGAR